MNFFHQLKYLVSPGHDIEVCEIIHENYRLHQLRNHIFRVVIYLLTALSDLFLGELDFSSLSSDTVNAFTVAMGLISAFLFGMLFRMYRRKNRWWESYTLFIVDVLFLLFLHWFYVAAEMYPDGRIGEYVLVVSFMFAFLNFVNIFKINVPYMLFGTVLTTLASVIAAMLAGEDFYVTIYFYSAFIVFFFGLLGTFITYLLRENIVVTRDLENAARTDPLTGLSNRRDMHEKITAEVHRSRRSGNPFSLILFDIDHFKVFNDNFGHDCGDRVLMETTEKLRDSIRKQDVVSRWGGEEFLVLLPETTRTGARVVGEKMRETVRTHTVSFNDKKHRVTITGGISTFSGDESVDECIKTADERLYAGKENGRDRVVG